MKAMRIIAVVLAAGVLPALLSAPALAGSASPSPTPSATPSVQASASPTPAPDFAEPKKPGFFDVIGRVRYAISQWFAGLVTAALRPVFDLLGRTIFSTPALASNARVVDLWRFSLGIADVALLLFVLAGAGIVMGGSSLTSQLTAKELLPRLVLAAGAANVSLLLVGELIQVSNALSRAMLGAALSPGDVSARMIDMLGTAALANPFLALFALAVIVLAILVVIAYVVRIAALVLLATGAPLMLAGHALPQTEGVARTWWRATLAFLVAPVIQSMLLAAAFRVFLTGDGVLGLPIGGGLIDLLVVGCLLYMLYKVPFWALNVALTGAGSRAWGRAKASAKAAGSAAAKAVTPA
jgi:hypothetical protein